MKGIPPTEGHSPTGDSIARDGSAYGKNGPSKGHSHPRDHIGLNKAEHKGMGPSEGHSLSAGRCRIERDMSGHENHATTYVALTS